MSNNLGPLGFPRLTSVGPFVGNADDFSESIDNDEVSQMILEEMGEAEIPRDNPTDEQLGQIVGKVANRIYPNDNAVHRAKKTRLVTCLTNQWAEKWAHGLARSTKTANSDDKLEMLNLKFKGCVGVTESNVPDDVRFIPDRFK
jgi:hypothetical protein